MKILDAAQIRECDKFTIENEPIASIDLMERAATAITEWMVENILNTTHICFFAGTGNNGGDALAVARQLAGRQANQITVYLLNISDKKSADYQANLERLRHTSGVEIVEINANDPMPQIAPGSIVVDGIFGSGLNRPITGYWAEIINHINSSGNASIAIDIPSGLYCWDNTGNDGAIINATVTLSLQLAKLPYMFFENSRYVGELEILPIGISQQAIDESDSMHFLTEMQDIRELTKPRWHFAHKGTFGHALLVAGSKRMTGASVLASRACLHAGCGLLTTCVPNTCRCVLQTTVPEAIVNTDGLDFDFSKIEKYTAVGIGPGIGLLGQTRQLFEKILDNAQMPMVIDADGINILADTPHLLQKLRPYTIITPHVGEFDRLTHKHATGYERLQTQIEIARQYNIIVVLKGAYTSIALPNGKVHFNTTGNPGMATAGSGDVLTGIILSLLAQKYTPQNAAIIGVYLHGLAGDIAKQENGEEFLIASNIIENIGKAYLKIKENEDWKHFF